MTNILEAKKSDDEKKGEERLMTFDARVFFIQKEEDPFCALRVKDGR